MFDAQTASTALRRTLQVAFAAFILAMTLPALAQPANGSVHRGFLALGSGSSVALPDGSWEVTLGGTYNTGATPWQFYTLKNQAPDATIPMLIVRHTQVTGRWGGTPCQAQRSTHFMPNEHGTRPSELLNKCSRFFSLPDVRGWVDGLAQHQDPGVRAWWQEALPGLQELRKQGAVSIMLAEMRVQLFNQRIVHVDAFLYPPRGVRTPEFRQRALDGRMSPEHDILGNWASIYIESMQKTFFDKKPQPVMPIAYVPNLQRPGDTMVAAAPAAPAQPAAAPAIAAPAPAAAAATAPAPAPVAAPVPAAGPAPTPAPARINPPTVVAAASPAPTPVPAAPSPEASAERQRIEAERRALEQERQQVAQQLDAMRQMLARLQQENAAAAAVAAARAQEAQAAAAPTGPVVYANRKALVIGNDAYTHVSKLNNAAADAEAMAKSLEAVGYKVTKHLNLDERRFKQVLRDFRQNLQGGDEVLFFFAGHGVQLGNANYLLPVDIRNDGEDQVRDESILLQKILDEFDEKKAKFTLAVIDACRDNPFKAKGRAIGGRGLAPTSAATGQMVMFSAGAGQQALDRLGDNDKERNGLFTRIFVKEMQKPGVSVDRVLRNVRNEVVRLAKTVGHEQTPALYDQAIGEFYFKQ
ncbi:MAG: hypothetical protein RL522_1609 [Pseudomonadota bacterium]